MQLEPSAAMLLPLTNALTTTAQQQAASPLLGRELLKTLVDVMPMLDGAALYELAAEAALYRTHSGSGFDDNAIRQLAFSAYPAVAAAFADSAVVTLPAGEGLLAVFPFNIGEADIHATNALLAYLPDADDLAPEVETALTVAIRLFALALNQQQTLITAQAVLDAPDPETMALTLYKSLYHPPDRLVLQRIEYAVTGQVARIHDFLVVEPTGLRTPEDQSYDPAETGIMPYATAMVGGDFWIVDDVANDDQLDDTIRAFLTHNGIGAIAAYPLRDAEGMVGHLMLALYNTPHTYTENEINILQTASRQAGVIMRNWQLFKDARRQTFRLQEQVRITRSLYEIGHSLSSALDLDDLMQLAAENLYNALNVDHVGIVMFSDDRTTGTTIAEYPLMDAVGTVYDLRGYPVQEYLETERRTFICNDVTTDERLGHAASQLIALGIKALMIVPLIVGDDLVGSIGLDLMETRRPFTEDETNLAEAVASQLAISTQNAVLFSQAQQRESSLLQTQDVLEQRVAERTRELEQSEAELRALFKGMTDVVIVYDRQGRYVRVAPTSPDRQYNPATEMVGRTVHDLLPPDIAAQIVEAIEQALDTGQPQSLEYNLPIDEQQVWFSASLSPLLDNQVVLVARDITERKMYEEQLTELSLAVEQSPSIVIITDPDGSIEYVNPKFTEITGYSFQEALGQNVTFLRHSATDTGDLWATISAGEEWRGEFHNRKKDGASFWASASISPIRDDQGNIVRFLALQEDITEQIRVSRDLRDQQTFLRQVIDVNPNLIFAKDREGRLTLINKSMAELIYNDTPENLLYRTHSELGGTLEEEQIFLADDHEVMDSGTMKYIPEEQLTDVHGDVRWMQTIKVPLYDDAGEASQILGVAVDVTERKQLLDQIERSLARRGQEVQLSTDIAQEIAAATEIEELFERVVTLVKERFGYYHAQIFRFDSAAQVMRLVTGYGEAGEKMLTAGHNLPVARGVVGTAAASVRSVLASDVREDPDWVPHPTLPATQGELAVPIVLRGELLGILDVQSEVSGALTPEDQILLEGLCGQIALAIESTRLLEEANLFRQLVEASNQGIGIVDLDGRIEYLNPAMLTIMNADTVPYHEQVTDFYLADARTTLQDELIPEVLQKGAWHGELTLQSREGKLIPTLQNAFIIRNREGQPQYIANQITDISERKALEQRVQVERDLLRTLIDNLPDYIFIKDRQSRIVITNRAHAVNVLGAGSPQEAIGKTDFDFFPNNLADQYYAAEQELMKSGIAIQGEEYPSQSADGRSVWHLNTKVPQMDADGNIIGLIGIVRDITDLKERDIEREELLEAERAQRQLAEILAEVSLTLNAQTDTTAMLDEILAYARQLVPSGLAASIVLQQGNYLRLERWSVEESLLNPELHLGQLIPREAMPLTAHAIDHAEPVLVENVADSERRGLAQLGMDWIQSYIVLPIHLRDIVLGVIWIAADTPGQMTERDINRLQPLANAAAISLDNARLLETVQQRAEREQRLNAIGIRLQESADVTALLNTALEELGDALGAKVGRVRLTLGQEQPESPPAEANGRGNGHENGRTD
jgi:PAS domain S-box-containing protein